MSAMSDNCPTIWTFQFWKKKMRKKQNCKKERNKKGKILQRKNLIFLLRVLENQNK